MSSLGLCTHDAAKLDGESSSLSKPLVPTTSFRRKSDLIIATKQLREKHQRVLNFGRRKISLLDDNISVYSLKSLDDVKELQPDKFDFLDQFSGTSESQLVKVRRHRSNCQLRFHKDMMSLPSMHRQLSSPALQIGVDDRAQTISSNLRNNRYSWNSIGSGGSNSSLTDLLSENVRERQEEAAALAEKERLQRIILMSANSQQEAKPLENTKASLSPPFVSARPRSGDFGSNRASRDPEQSEFTEMTAFPDHVTRSAIARIRRQTSDLQRQVTEQDDAVRAVSPAMSKILNNLHLYQSRKPLIRDIEQVITELEGQLSLCMKELEIDKALAEVKLNAERKCLSDEEKRCELLKEKILNLEEEYMARREKHQEEFENENVKLDELRNEIEETRSQIDNTSESMKEVMEEKLRMAEETLDQETKKREDAEFHMLETISNLDEEKEEMQKNLILQKKNLVLKINNRKNRVEMLQGQLKELTAKQKLENQRLNKERDSAIELLQEVAKQRNGFYSSFSNKPRKDVGIQFVTGQVGPGPTSKPLKSDKQKFLHIDDFINSLSYSGSQDRDPSKRDEGSYEYKEISHDFSPSQKTTKSVDKISSTRVHIQPLSSNPSYEKLNVEESSSEQSSGKRVAIMRLNSGSDTSRRRILTDRRSACSIDSIDNILANNADYERLLEMRKQLAEAKAKREMLLSTLNQSQHCERLHVPEEDPSSKISSENETKPFKENNAQVVLRSNNLRRQARPSSRFLPVRSSNFDLREHIEACGHNPFSCREVMLTATSCRGHLSKKCSKINLWRKRWFVFDRTSKCFIYYKNKKEIKEKGKIYFENIEDVFFDHLKSQKSSNPSLTFCVKCYSRVHYFTAPSAEAMRIWMDAIVTGAEGYREYMKTLDK